MATQKETIKDVQNVALDLGHTVSIRKNSYGEYEARVRPCGSRVVLAEYFSGDFEDAVQTVRWELSKIADEQRKEGKRREAQYERDLQTVLDQAQIILNLVGCRIEIDAANTVTMYSPKTGQHSLCMKLGVRPVSDLLAHVCGFAEQQTHRQPKVEAPKVETHIGRAVRHESPLFAGERGIVIAEEGPILTVQWNGMHGTTHDERNNVTRVIFLD